MALIPAANLQPNASSDRNGIKSKVVEHTMGHWLVSSLNDLQWTLRRVRFSTLADTLASDGLTALQMTRASWSLQVGVRRHTLVVMLPSTVTCPRTKNCNNFLEFFEIIRCTKEKIAVCTRWRWLEWKEQSLGAHCWPTFCVWRNFYSRQDFGSKSEKWIHIFKIASNKLPLSLCRDSQSERQQQEESSEAAVCYLMISRRSCVPWSRSKTQIHLQHLFFLFIYLFWPFDPAGVGSPVSTPAIIALFELLLFSLKISSTRIFCLILINFIWIDSSWPALHFIFWHWNCRVKGLDVIELKLIAWLGTIWQRPFVFRIFQWTTWSYRNGFKERFVELLKSYRMMYNLTEFK